MEEDKGEGWRVRPVKWKRAWIMVVDLDLGTVDKTMDCGAEMGLDHEAVDETMEDLVAMVEPAEMETTRVSQ